ncbi:cell division protein FtsZ [Portibacter marinus]|uniref:cell division protein FtsZ n=1 Tax=Portibacter marinus TaxID=2898660 RepID=UPI001F18ADAA|nr:cell division protein FtsZ [Portibacter marinus]
MLFDLVKDNRSIIKVIGVGGGGSNAVNHMYSNGIKGVDFAICNTDNQALEASPIPVKIHLGPNLTEGRGAGSKPEVGKQACIESVEEVRRFLDDGTKMLFITAGMGGGTGTGAAPIIAKVSRDLDILTVGIVTLPFKFEGLTRSRQALEGMEELKAHVDAILVISNDRLGEIYGDLKLTTAFANADNILSTAAKGIAEIITVPGKINVDFEDVNTVMRNSGVAIMGNALIGGENRARLAIEQALSSPLLKDNDIRGAQHILLNITTSVEHEVTMSELGEITEYMQEEAGYGTNLIWGHCNDEELDDKLSITLIATGFEEKGRANTKKEVERIVVPLEPETAMVQQEEEDDIFSTHIEPPAAETIEFDNPAPRRNISQVHAERAFDLYDLQKNDEKSQKEMEYERKMRELEESRRQSLRANNHKNLDDPKTVNEYTKVPAYARRNVELEDVEHSSAHPGGRYTVSIDDEGGLRSGNSYIHDNVD